MEARMGPLFRTTFSSPWAKPQIADSLNSRKYCNTTYIILLTTSEVPPTMDTPPPFFPVRLTNGPSASVNERSRGKTVKRKKRRQRSSATFLLSLSLSQVSLPRHPRQPSLPLRDPLNPFRLPHPASIFLPVLPPATKLLSLSLSQHSLLRNQPILPNPFQHRPSPPNLSRLPNLTAPSSLPTPFRLSLVLRLSPVVPQRTLLVPKSRLPLRSTNWCMLVTRPSYIGSAVVVPHLLLPPWLLTR